MLTKACRCSSLVCYYFSRGLHDLTWRWSCWDVNSREDLQVLKFCSAAQTFTSWFSSVFEVEGLRLRSLFLIQRVCGWQGKTNVWKKNQTSITSGDFPAYYESMFIYRDDTFLTVKSEIYLQLFCCLSFQRIPNSQLLNKGKVCFCWFFCQIWISDICRNLQAAPCY